MKNKKIGSLLVMFLLVGTLFLGLIPEVNAQSTLLITSKYSFLLNPNFMNI